MNASIDDSGNKPVIVLRPEWGGVFAWLRNADGTHDFFGFSARWDDRPKAFRDATGASRETVRALCEWQTAFENCIEPEDAPFWRSRDPRVKSILKLLDARAFELARRLKGEIGARFRVAVAPLCRKWRDVEV